MKDILLTIVSFLSGLTLLYALASLPKLFSESWNFYGDSQESTHWTFLFLIFQGLLFVTTVVYCLFLVFLFFVQRVQLSGVLEQL